MNTLQESPENQTIGDLRDELKDLNITIKKSSEETSKFTKILMIFAVIQIFIAIGQALLTVNDSGYQWGALLIYAGLLVGVVYILKSSDFIFKEK